MTWIAYKRDGEFYAKERGNPASETRIDYELFRWVQATGQIAEVQDGNAASGKVVKATKGGGGHSAKHPTAQAENLEQHPDASQNAPDEV